MPLRQDLETAYPDYFTEHPDYTSFAAQAARTVEVPNVTNSIEIWQDFRDQYSSSVIFGKTSVDEALSKAADQVDTLAGES
jgi:multiple sugar transport system substrate-binding protein